jgi:CelD/BcsL family acetyltransferase involved in cellulose biosynthesis
MASAGTSRSCGRAPRSGEAQRRLPSAPTIVRIERIEHLDELEPAWSSIETRRPATPVFQSWLWSSTWARTVIPEIKGARLQSYVVSSDAGDALAVLPCFRASLAGGALGIVRFLGDRMSFVNDLVCASADEALAEELVARLGPLLGRRELAHLKHLNGTSPFTRALIREGAAELQCRRLIISREGGDGEPLARLGRKSRRTLNWQRNRLQKTFGAARYRVVSREETARAFDRFVDFHRARFRRRGHATLLGGANLRFLRTVFLELCQLGRAEILELEAGERPIATLLAIIDGERYYSVNSGFDVSFEQFSPMKLLLTEGMRRAFALGCEHFELGPDYEPYKQMWRPTGEASYAACLSGPGLVSRMGAAGYRAAFRRVTHPREPRAAAG